MHLPTSPPPLHPHLLPRPFQLKRQRVILRDAVGGKRTPQGRLILPRSLALLVPRIPRPHPRTLRLQLRPRVLRQGGAVGSAVGVQHGEPEPHVGACSGGDGHRSRQDGRVRGLRIGRWKRCYGDRVVVMLMMVLLLLLSPMLVPAAHPAPERKVGGQILWV